MLPLLLIINDFRMLISLQQTANEYLNLRSGLIERKEGALAREWRFRYEQLQRAEEAIFGGSSRPDREIVQLTASKPPTMRDLYFEYALPHSLPKIVSSWHIKSRQNSRRMSTPVASAAARLYASSRRPLEKKRLSAAQRARRGRNASLE